MDFTLNSFATGTRVSRKTHNADGRERKQQQCDSVGGVAHCETSVRLEQECGENQASHHDDEQARQATPEVTDRNDQEQKYCRARWLCRASSEEQGEGKGQSPTEQDYQRQL
jgi:hypothetical protein